MRTYLKAEVPGQNEVSFMDDDKLGTYAVLYGKEEHRYLSLWLATETFKNCFLHAMSCAGKR